MAIFRSTPFRALHLPLVCGMLALGAGCLAPSQVQFGAKAASTSGGDDADSGGGGASTLPAGTVRLHWAAAAGSPDLYQVEQSNDGVTFSQVQTAAGSSVTTDITGLTPGATYRFRMRSQNSAGLSSYTPVVAIRAAL